MGPLVQISAAGPHQGLLRREDCHLLRLAGLLHGLAAAGLPGRSGRLHHGSGHPGPEHHRPGSVQDSSRKVRKGGDLIRASSELQSIILLQSQYVSSLRGLPHLDSGQEVWILQIRLSL